MAKHTKGSYQSPSRQIARDCSNSAECYCQSFLCAFPDLNVADISFRCIFHFYECGSSLIDGFHQSRCSHGAFLLVRLPASTSQPRHQVQLYTLVFITFEISFNDVSVKQLYRDFISACHILHHHGFVSAILFPRHQICIHSRHVSVLDAYGHLSVWHPLYHDRFIVPGYIDPAAISSESDMIEYYIHDAELVNPHAPKFCSERFIHSEILERFSDVNAVIHSHSEAVIPFRACFHIGQFSWEQRHPYAISGTATNLVNLKIYWYATFELERLWWRISARPLLMTKAGRSRITVV